MNLLVFAFLLWLVYLALTADLSLANLILGLGVAGLVTWLLRQRPHGFSWHHLARKPLDLAIYLATLGLDSLRSGLQVMRLVLTPTMPIDPGILAVQVPLQGELGLALSGHAFCITPGELVVEFDPQGILYIHSLVLSESRQTDLHEQRWRILQRLLD